MFVKIKGRCFDIFEGKTVNYCSFNDVESGGTVKLGIDKAFEVKLDQLVQINAEIKSSQGKSGQFLTVVKMLPSQEKGG